MYTLLPTNAASPTVWYRPNRRLVYGILLFVACLITGAVVRLAIPVPYSPLLNYQNLNAPPLISEVVTHSTTSSDRRAVVTTLYSDSYAIGVAVLGHSVQKANVTSRLLLAYLEGDGRVSSRALCIARAVGWEPYPVSFIPPPHNGKGIHHRFYDQYTKLNIWGLDKHGIDKAVYLDGDTLVRRNFDELFDIPFDFAAVPDVYRDKRGFAISFNAGVIGFRPSSAVLEVMKQRIETAKFPLDQAEQSFLNLFFSANVLRLPYAYNANLAIKEVSPAMWDGMKDEIRIVHYTLTKPFLDDLSESSTSILTVEMQREAIARAAEQDGGMFAEEVGWWRDSYNEMMNSAGAQIQGCLG
ncbi:glycosyltransferase family 8 protein [Tricholoma matsutake]|nr:glycosyltransferase family 8 protein [Tricholoma matsutake 945]